MRSGQVAVAAVVALVGTGVLHLAAFFAVLAAYGFDMRGDNAASIVAWLAPPLLMAGIVGATAKWGSRSWAIGLAIGTALESLVATGGCGPEAIRFLD